MISPKLDIRRLRLCEVPKFLHAQTREAFKNGDGIGFIVTAPSQGTMLHLFRNAELLAKRGILEKAFLFACSVGRISCTALLPSNHMNYLINLCERNRLLAAGDPLPEGDNFILYRGVASADDMDAIRRWSWTSSPEIASWFAQIASSHFKTNNPAVFRLKVNRKQILAHIGDTNEMEFLVQLKKQDKPARVEPRPQAISPSGKQIAEGQLI